MKSKGFVKNAFWNLVLIKLNYSHLVKCWTLNGDFFKVTTLQSWWVLEWTDNRSYASNDCFEDVDPMPYDISKTDILEQTNLLLLK